jgi:hypothetical protein
MMVAAIARAQGNVLHAVMLHDALRDLPTEQRRADRIPRGFKELIGDVWDRAASHAAMRAGLGLLCAAQQARSLDILAELAGWSYDDKQCARAQSPSDVVNAGAKLLGNGRTTSSIPRSDRSSKTARHRVTRGDLESPPRCGERTQLAAAELLVYATFVLPLVFLLS